MDDEIQKGVKGWLELDIILWLPDCIIACNSLLESK